MFWRTKIGEIDLTSRALVMGILNVTADSFFDGGKFLGVEDAVAHAASMAADGAEIIDIGGESTRPGAEPVSAEVEMERVLPVIQRMKDEVGRMNSEDAKLHPSSFTPHPCPFISIDTSKAVVARAAIERGASIINDVTGLRGDPAMIDVARETGAGVIIMHMQGTPRDMQRKPIYDDVVAEVREFFRQSFRRAVTSGIHPMSIAFDPGIGFGKSVTHNLLLLKNLAALRVGERPLVLGVSRKSFISKVLAGAAAQSERGGAKPIRLASLAQDKLDGVEEPHGIKNGLNPASTDFSRGSSTPLRSPRNDNALDERFWPTVALTSFGREHGANVLRVHDVKPNCEALRMTEAILGA